MFTLPVTPFGSPPSPVTNVLWIYLRCRQNVLLCCWAEDLQPQCILLRVTSGWVGGWVGRRLLLSGWNQYPLLGLWKSIQLWKAAETLITARPSSPQPQLPCGFWLFWLQTYFFVDRGPLKFDYYEPNPSLSSPACYANPLEAGRVL